MRIRKVDNDFHRMARQQQVVQALQKKVAAAQHLPPALDRQEFIKRDRHRPHGRQLIELAYLKWRTPQNQNFKFVMPGTPQYIGGVDYVVSDTTANQRLIKQFMSRVGAARGPASAPVRDAAGEALAAS